MTHGTKIVDLVGADVGDDGDKVGRITEITVVEEYFYSSFMPVFLDVFDTSSIDCGSTTDDSVNLII